MERLNKLLDTLYQYPKVLLLITLVIFAGLCTQLSSLRLDASADSLVLEGDKALQVFRDVSEKYGADEFLVVTFTPHGQLFDSKTLSTISDIKEQLLQLSDVDSVTTILDVPLLYSPPVEMGELEESIRYLSEPDIDKSLAKSEFGASPLYSQLLTSPNFDTTAMQVNIRRDTRFYELLEERDNLKTIANTATLSTTQKEALAKAEFAFSEYSKKARQRQDNLISSVRSILVTYGEEGEFFLGGVPMITSDMISFIRSDLVVFGAGILIFIVCLLTAIFRNLVWIALPLVTCIITTVGMLGVVAWLGWTLTVISSNFVALLLIITLSITIHLAVRFREVSRTHNGESSTQAVIQTMQLMFRPCLYTALTTIIAFASLVFSGIRPVIDFGWMMTIGVAAAMLISFIIIPSVLILLPLSASKMSGSVQSNTAFTGRFAVLVDKHGRWVWGICCALVVLSFFGISNLKVENRFIDYFDSSTEIYQGMELIDQKLGGTIPLEIVLRANTEGGSELAGGALSAVEEDEEDIFGGDIFESGFDSGSGFDAESNVPLGEQIPGYWFTRQGLNQIEQIHQFLDANESTGKVLSLNSIYQVLKDVSKSDVDDFQLALIGKNLPADIKGALVWPYLSEDGNESRLSIRVKETSHDLRRDELIREVEEYLTGQQGFEKADIEITGMLVLYNNMLQSLFGSQIQTLGTVFIAITLMFTVLFRSLSIALIAIAPNLLAAGMVLGVMGLMGIPLDMMTITIAAITIGIGVHDTIHYIHRFKEEFVKDRDYMATMYRCHNSIGRAMLYTSIIIIMGFSILSLSNFTPTIFFGLLTGFAMLSALLGALLLLPKLIVSVRPLGAES